MNKLNNWIYSGLVGLFFVLFINPKTRPFSYLILIPAIIGGGIALIGYAIVKLSQRK
jgi:hypothetical protein